MFVNVGCWNQAACLLANGAHFNYYLIHGCVKGAAFVIVSRGVAVNGFHVIAETGPFVLKLLGAGEAGVDSLSCCHFVSVSSHVCVCVCAGKKQWWLCGRVRWGEVGGVGL